MARRRSVATHQIDQFCRRWGVAELALFGSLARGDFREDSDADLLVKFEPGVRRSIHDYLAMKAELRGIFGREVDLVEEELIDNPFRRYNIMLEKAVLYPRAAKLDQLRDAPEKLDRDLALIWDVVQAGRRVLEATRGKSFAGYQSGWLLRSAVERQLILIGQACRGLSDGFRAAHSEIPWASIIGERNILVHAYEKVDDQKVWVIASEEIPRLVELLQRLLPEEPRMH